MLVDKNLTITGPGASVLTVKRSTATTDFRVFEIQTSKTVTISGMTISNGRFIGAVGGAGATGDSVAGGGVSNDGTLTLLNVIVSGNHITAGAGGAGTPTGGGGGDANGGGIFNTGTLTLTNTTVSGNTATAGKGGSSDVTPGDGGSSWGGGVYNLGTLTLTNSTVASNTATAGAGGDYTGGPPANPGLPGGTAGGGVFSIGTLLTINNSTFSDNHAVGPFAEGGGIDSEGGTLTINNSTISGNTSDGIGGGLLNCGDTTAVLTGVTITNNRADADNDGFGSGGGISQTSSNSITLRNTIVAGNFIVGPQVETATVVGTIATQTNQAQTLTVTTVGGLPLTTDGNAQVTVTAAGMNAGTPKTILVPVLTLDDADAVAGKIRAALTADADIGDAGTGFFTVSGTGPNVVLTAKAFAANDGTMNVSIDSCTCTGLDPVPNSTNTPPVASGAGNATVTVTAAGMTGTPRTLDVAVLDGDDASTVADKMRTALAGDTDVNTFFNVSGANDQIILTAKTAAANDPTMNIATANGTASGLTPEPTSANTQAGGITIADDFNGNVDAASSFNLIGVDTGMTGISNGTSQQSGGNCGHAD